MADGPRLKVRHYKTWTGDLDDALRGIPELSTCSHELYSRLARNQRGPRKRYAVVSERNRPIAVVESGSQPGRDGEWVSRASTHDQLRRIEYIGTIYIEMI
jgi:hypothetical protein